MTFRSTSATRTRARTPRLVADGATWTKVTAEYDAAIGDAAALGTATDDRFEDLIAHLARVHPSRYIRLIEGVDTVGLRDVDVFTDQSAAL